MLSLSLLSLLYFGLVGVCFLHCRMLRDQRFEAFSALECRTYLYIYSCVLVVLTLTIAHNAATTVLSAHDKFDVLQWLFLPIGIGFIGVYATIYDTKRISEAVSARMSFSDIMRTNLTHYPSIMRVFVMLVWVGQVALGMATILMFKFLN